jgi:hypothetical protein
MVTPGAGGNGGGGNGGVWPTATANASPPAVRSTEGTANTGGGGGGGAANPVTSIGRAGGSGVVIVKEPDKGVSASSCWDLKTLYRNVKAGTWPTV